MIDRHMSAKTDGQVFGFDDGRCIVFIHNFEDESGNPDTESSIPYKVGQVLKIWQRIRICSDHPPLAPSRQGRGNFLGEGNIKCFLCRYGIEQAC